MKQCEDSESEYFTSEHFAIFVLYIRCVEALTEIYKYMLVCISFYFFAHEFLFHLSSILLFCYVSVI